jgi:hypothetical protein
LLEEEVEVRIGLEEGGPARVHRTLGKKDLQERVQGEDLGHAEQLRPQGLEGRGAGHRDLSHGLQGPEGGEGQDTVAQASCGQHQDGGAFLHGGIIAADIEGLGNRDER